MSETNNKGVKVLASASLLFVTIIWGSAFVVMKNSMDAITPTYLLAYRFPILPVYDRGAWDGGSFLETDPGNVDAGV